VIDLRTIVPLDVPTILASVAKTGRLLIVDEAYAMCGIGSEIAAIVMEEAFDELDAPVGRLHTEPVSHPFSPAFDDAVLSSVDKPVATAREVIAGRPPKPYRAASFACTAAKPAASVEPATPEPVATADAAQASQPTAKPSVDGVPVVMPNMDLIITEATVV